jgi:acetyl-CoA carboxylase carboxyl transferase subunit alpha
VGQLLAAMLDVPVPTVGVILGQGASAAALPFATTDHLIMTDESWYSVISSEGAAAAIWRDASKAPEAAAALRLTAQALKEQGIIDHVVPRRPKGRALGDVLKPLILECFRQTGDSVGNPERRARMAL